MTFAISRSSLIHLRLPFSFFLLPIFLLALLMADSVIWFKAGMVFFILHFLIYTASNAFNTYFDRDDGSIGTLENPPKVTPDLLWLALGLDAAALFLAYGVNRWFFLGCLIYGLASKAYSLPKIRIKKRPWIGWLLTGLGQGSLTFFMIVQAVSDCPPSHLARVNILLPALAVGFFTLGLYPLTQIYQHSADRKRGDITISLYLGILPTFRLSLPFLTLSMMLFSLIFKHRFGNGVLLLFILFSAPAALYAFHWFLRVRKNESAADYSHAMRLCFLTSLGTLCFASITGMIV